MADGWTVSGVILTAVNLICAAYSVLVHLILRWRRTKIAKFLLGEVVATEVIPQPNTVFDVRPIHTLMERINLGVDYLKGIAENTIAIRENSKKAADNSDRILENTNKILQEVRAIREHKGQEVDIGWAVEELLKVIQEEKAHTE